MNHDRLIRALAEKAAAEPTPTIDVAGRVMAALAHGSAQVRVRVDRPLVWFAACSAVLALVLALVGYAALDAMLDPLVDNFNALRWVTP